MEQYLPFALNAGFLVLGFWMGQRGLAKVWQDVTGDLAHIKAKLDELTHPTPPPAVVPATA